MFIFANMFSPMEKYLSALLHYHDCVIVPGLGGFVANRKEVTLHPSQHWFSPPAKEIGFNRSLLHQDGLLAHFVAQREKLAFEEAAAKVAAFSEQVRARVAGGETVVLDELGSLRADVIGNLVFSPNEEASFLPEAFGLSSFRFEPVDSRRTARIEAGRSLRSLPKVSSRYRVAAAAMLAGLFFLATPELRMPELNTASLASFPVESTPVLPLEEPVPVLAEELVAEVAAEPFVAAEESGRYYHLIAASFREEGPARAEAAALVRKGFDQAGVLPAGNSRYRISLQSFPTKASALQAMEDLRSRPGFASVWVHLEP